MKTLPSFSKTFKKVRTKILSVDSVIFAQSSVSGRCIRFHLRCKLDSNEHINNKNNKYNKVYGLTLLLLGSSVPPFPLEWE